MFTPVFLLNIEGQDVTQELADEVTSFVFEDNEEQLDVLEVTVVNRGLRFTDHPLLQENNLAVCRFGYADQWSPERRCVVREIDYDFPGDGVPTIRLKAFDQAVQLCSEERQRVWEKEAPGYRYDEIASEIAKEAGLTPVVEETAGYHLRVAQSNKTDANFLMELAGKSANSRGVSGYAFYVQDNELHFHTRPLEQGPTHTFEYFIDPNSTLMSFRPSTQPLWSSGAGQGTTAVGVDPRKREPVKETASNRESPDRTSLGSKTYLVDGKTGRFVPSYDRSESFHEEPAREPAKDEAEAKFTAAELRQIEATAVVVGDPTIKAKTNIEIQGVGRKFSGVYYVTSVRHTIDESGYRSELKLRRNALGRGAGEHSEDAAGRVNDTGEQGLPPPPPDVVVDANTGSIS